MRFYAVSIVHTFLSKIYRTRKYLHESNEDKSKKRNLLIEGT